ncbi:MAG: hypothetical protein WD398_04375 [Cyclobacteriaceae bacterium]
MAYWILSLGWVLFYSSHTFLASLKIKRKIHAILGKGYIWYRLVYSLFASLLFLAIFLYAGLILIFIGYFLYIPSLSSLIHLLGLLAYLPFGIDYEEKKLMEIYGAEYREYRSKVPPLIPRIIK